jgi:hypothetical protein
MVILHRQRFVFVRCNTRLFGGYYVLNETAIGRRRRASTPAKLVAMAKAIADQVPNLH